MIGGNSLRLFFAFLFIVGILRDIALNPVSFSFFACETMRAIAFCNPAFEHLVSPALERRRTKLRRGRQE